MIVRLVLAVFLSIQMSVHARIVAEHPGSNSLSSTESAVTTQQIAAAPAPEAVEQQGNGAPEGIFTASSSSTTTTELPTTSSTSTTEPSTTTTTTTTSTTTSTSTTTVPTTTTTLLPPTNEHGCYNAAPELCQARRTGECECSPDPVIPEALFCCNSTDINKAIGCASSGPDGSSWKYIHMRNLTVREFALNVSNRYIKTLLSLSITDGSIQKVTSSFARHSSPVCLNISNNNISEIEQRAFRDLVKLTMLDLSHNNLTTIPSIPVSQGSNIVKKLDVRGNVGMLCKPLQEALKDKITFVQKEETSCLTNTTFNWFDSTVNIPLEKLELTMRLEEECPKPCHCKLERLNFDLNNTEKKTITTQVNCSGQGLTDFPETLPPETVTLDVSNNNITNLKALIGKSYHSLINLYADDNQITSLSDLEGTDFISRFATFRIRRNKLKTIQTYQFTLNLDLGSIMYLEGNPFTCDCNAAKNLKNWLLSKKAQVNDHESIYCEGNTHMTKVEQIQESKLCQSQHDWTDYIYYVIAIEIILLVSLICKVSYDYWVFKTAGYLPWPANKMPKLPCDCLCE